MPALIVGNWKMNGLGEDIAEIAHMAGSGARSVWIAPPFTLIDRAVIVSAGAVKIGGQDCHANAKGAHTGCVSALMLADLGAGFVIVGHSERRRDNGESDADVRAKATAGRAAELEVILCIGETRAQRNAGQTEAVLTAQLAGSLPDDAEGLIIAYEPVWAIGTGLTPTLDDVKAAHAHIRGQIVARFGPNGHGVRILYGGSVTPANAADLLRVADVGGVLVGGASLTAESLLAIASSAP
ncbi:triose-phosphate isomerase [Sandarakinorhabdus limnophila]|uniref:triose-phosphate isomerase n=1 Tax=Sandarakinorhabdus limnophila TaxID=210512 RepID=UPI00040B2837|nr:triose-phosphate isomerase [Sandarakinorhabdus limnophila]